MRAVPVTPRSRVNIEPVEYTKETGVLGLSFADIYPNCAGKVRTAGKILGAHPASLTKLPQ